MQDHIFRMYDIRGIVGSELSIAQVYDCARAFAVYVRLVAPDSTTVAVGMDGRIHSPAIKDEFVRGLQDSGLNVIFIGVCPTPLVSFAEYWLSVQAACMITASHNPKEYNGIKFFLGKKAVFHQEIQKIHALFKTKSFLKATRRGSYTEHLLIPKYVAFLKRLFPHLVGTSLRLVFDCGNGAVGAVLPDVCKAFEFSSASILYQEVDGTYPHHEADPSVAENLVDLQNAVMQSKADVGIAFDGDGDRMGAVSGTAKVIPGDKLLGLFSQSILHVLPGARVVCDVKCSSGLHELVQRCGGSVVVSPSGHAFIRDAMEREKGLIGGELSCHFFFKDRYFGYDDGIYAALRLIEFLLLSKTTLDDFLNTFPYRLSSPEMRIACKQGEGPMVVQEVVDQVKYCSDYEVSTVDGVRVQTKDGWGLLRASNTQPVICLRLESDSPEGLYRIKRIFIDLLHGRYSKEYLQAVMDYEGI